MPCPQTSQVTRSHAVQHGKRSTVCSAELVNLSLHSKPVPALAVAHPCCPALAVAGSHKKTSLTCGKPLDFRRGMMKLEVVTLLDTLDPSETHAPRCLIACRRSRARDRHLQRSVARDHTRRETRASQECPIVCTSSMQQTSGRPGVDQWCAGMVPISIFYALHILTSLTLQSPAIVIERACPLGSQSISETRTPRSHSTQVHIASPCHRRTRT